MKVGGKLRPFGGLTCAGALALLFGACAQEPYPTPHTKNLRISEEVFRMFCMRIVQSDHPNEPDGTGYEAVCQGRSTTPPVSTPRLNALLLRRGELVDALDQIFAEGNGTQVPSISSFEPDELTAFLASLIPYYDDETLPKSTRAMASVALKLLDQGDARAKEVLNTFARMSPRTGYRSGADILATVRPALSYPRVDQMSQQLLSFVGEGGPAHDVFLELLRAGALELAEPAETVADADLPQSNLRLTHDLLVQEDPSFKEPGAPEKLYVKRDAKGVAIQSTATPVSPFAVYGVNDGVPRDDKGRALTAPAQQGGQLVHQYGDANRTLLAALMRDQKPLLARKTPNEPAPVEKLLRGVRAILGNTKPRTEPFVVRAAAPNSPEQKGTFSYMGPDIEKSPLIDLVHAGTQLLRYPETFRLIKVLEELLKTDENGAAAPMYAGLAIDKRADLPVHAKALLAGYDGKLGGTNEFWDDLIDIGMKMAQRKGLLYEAAKVLSSPEGAAQARLMAKFMGYRDNIPYVGAPVQPGADGKFAQADADKFNTPITQQYAEQVMRMEGGDIGLNRSLFQRLVSTINATNKAPNCNKEGATLYAKDPTTGTNLNFPNPTAKPAQCNGDFICDGAAATAYTTINLLCAAPPDGAKDKYAKCQFNQQSNGAEMHMRAMIGRSEVKLKDKQLGCLNDAGLAGDLSKTQEESAQIKGFTLKPSAESIARFIHVPRNKWASDLFDPFPTIHGEPMRTYEPNMLMALEVKDQGITVGGQPQSFLTSSKSLVTVFDDKETFEDTPNGKEAKGGYLFADLLGMLHMHWPSRRMSECPRSESDPVCAGLGLTGTACTAGCSQSLDPTKPYYSRQSNIVSYEPLLIEAFETERLSDLLAVSAEAIKKINVDGKDGLTIVGEFLERILTPDPALTTFSNGAKYAKTNTCVSEVVDKATGEGTCGCPAGSTPVDAADAKSGCKLPSGAVFPRGRIIPQTTPLHLVLDGLRRFDQAFEDPMWKDRLAPWREARSALVDQFLTVNKTPDASDPMDPAKAKYTMANPRARIVGSKLLNFLAGRIEHYRGKSEDELAKWATSLPGRLAGVLGHPLTARGLDLYEKLWEKIGEGGPADEMARFNTYLLDPAQQDVFGGIALAAIDTLELADRDRSLTPAIQFAALTLAENSFNALDSLMGTQTAPNTEAGTATCSLEVTRKVAMLHQGKTTLSPLTRILRNAVIGNPAKGGRAPLLTLVDAIADVNRADPNMPTTAPHSAEDARAVFEQLRLFLFDSDRGLERLYKVIDSRDLLNKEKVQ
jgi:hypothetical protein